MTDEIPAGGGQKKKRGGSDKRQRNKRSYLRHTEEEFNRIAAKADRAGLSFAAFARAALLGDAGPRAQRRPPADHQALRQLLGQIGRISNNANQTARVLNTVQNASLPEARQALLVLDEIRDALLDIRNAILDALGKGHAPSRDH